MGTKLGKKFSDTMEKLINSALLDKFTGAVVEVQGAIVAQYDEELVDVVTDRNSKTNPNFYRDDFISRLMKFKYLSKSGNTLTLSVPDMDTFDFSGRLKVIEAIMHGTAGTHIEIGEDDYLKAFGKRPINQDPLDEYVPPSERIYILRYTSKVRQIEKDLGKKFVRYPFSNTPPIRIFDAGVKFVENNMSRWIKESLKEAQKIFATNYKGAHL